MTDGKVDWPAGFERTPAHERTRYPHSFRVSRRKAFDSIVEELEKMGVDDYRVETAAPHTTANPHQPYKDRDPEDPAVVVYWTRDGEQFAAPCDRWNNLRDNARAIAKYLDAKRALDRYGVETIGTEFATQALPSGEDAGDAPPHEILGVSPDADAGTIKRAARERKKEHHPDQGGNPETFKRITRAESILLRGGER